jgi:toxin YoeB
MSRTIAFEPRALADLRTLAATTPKLAVKVLDLIEDSRRTPFSGLGKPEPLSGDYKGCWSRRINDEHRLIYKATDNEIIILACKGHYE